MFKSTILSFSFVIISILFSCNGKKETTLQSPVPEVPDALQESKMEIKSYSRSMDLVEELYKELVEKTPDLKKLEEDLSRIEPKTNELDNQFKTYKGKSAQYYSSADFHVTSIRDSALRMKMISYLTNSSTNYNNIKKEHEVLFEKIATYNVSLHDHHTVLKLALTLPIIEAYQKKNIQDKKPLKELIKEQENLVKQMDTTIPFK